MPLGRARYALQSEASPGHKVELSPLDRLRRNHAQQVNERGL